MLWDCVHTKGSAMNVDFGRKLSCLTQESNLHQQYTGPDAQPTELQPHLWDTAEDSLCTKFYQQGMCFEVWYTNKHKANDSTGMSQKT